MKSLRFLLLASLILAVGFSANAQSFFSEDFEGTPGTGSIPTGWAESGLSTDGIYSMGDATAASSTYWTVPAHTNFVYTNDDACNCDKSVDRLSLPVQNFTGRTNVVLTFDYMFPIYLGSAVTVQVSTNGGTNWTVVDSLPGNTDWTDGYTVDLSAYNNNASVLISFLYDDQSGWEFGLTLDNVDLSEPPASDLAMTNFTGEYVLIPESQLQPLTVEAEVSNVGSNNATDAVVTANVYLAPNLTTSLQTLTSTPTAINGGASANINIGTYTPTALGTYVIQYVVSSATLGDVNATNDTINYVFALTENIYSRDDGSPTTALGLANTTLRMGTLYEFNNVGFIDSVYVASQGQATGDSLQIEIYTTTAGTPTTLVATSAVYVFSAAEAGVAAGRTFAVTDLAGQPFSVTAGTTYYVAVKSDYEGNLGLLYCPYLYRANTSLINFDGGAFSDITAVGGGPLEPMIRPIVRCAISATSSSLDATCGGPDGSATITATGTAPYTYAWNGGQTTATATGLTPGDYTVTVTDAAGCELSDTVTVFSSLLILSTNATTTASACGGATGSASVTVSNGFAPYTYLWNDGQTTATAANLAAGSYTVTVTDSYGCVGTETTNVSNPNSPTISAPTTTDVACNGGTTGAIDITVSGGTAPYTFNWSNGATTEDLSGLAAGSYTGTITDANNCAVVGGPLTIAEPTAIAISAATTTDVACNGDANGAIDITVSGGTGAYTFSWSNSATTEDLSGLTAGSYTGTITDANGCTTVGGPLTIAEPAALAVTGAVTTNVSCNSAADGAIDLSVGGGTAPYTFNWSNSATTEDLSSLAPGSYTGTITDANGCTTVGGPVDITEPDSLNLSATVTDASTAGGTDGAVDLTVTGGTAPYTFSWSNGATTEDLTGVAAGSYTGTITDANGCAISATVTVLDGPSSVVISSDEIQVNLFPNPAKTVSTLTINLNTIADVNVEVVNVTGQVLSNLTVADVLDTQVELNMTDWAAGVYFVRITAGNETATYRLIKQ